MRETRRFAHGAESVRAARHFATEALSDAPPEAIEVVQLLVSEMASNCIQHTTTEFDLAVVREAGAIRVEATDFGGGVPRRRTPATSDLSGRGLQIIDMLSESWGYEPRVPVGKTVWFRIATRTET